MYRIYFENIVLDTLFKGYKGLILEPHIGPYRVKIMTNTSVRIKYMESSPPARRLKDDIVCLYILFYGNHIKLGTSTLTNVVSRMYFQAPIMGIIYSCYILYQDLELSTDIDKMVCRDPIKTFHDKVISCETPSNEIIINAWKNYSGDYNSFLKISQELSTYFEKILSGRTEFERIYPVNTYWFTSYIDHDIIEQINSLNIKSDSMLRSLLKRSCRKTCRGKLMFFPNGLCLINLFKRSYLVPCNRINRYALFELE